MAYEDKEQKKTHRHTVRFKTEDNQLIELLAKRLGLQKATLIQNMALLAAEKELQKIGLGGQQQAASMGSAALHC